MLQCYYKEYCSNPRKVRKAQKLEVEKRKKWKPKPQLMYND